MSFTSCEFCSKDAIFTVRENDMGVIRERHVCVEHARELCLPVGTYVYEDRKYPSFAQLAAAVIGKDHFLHH